MYIFFWIVIYLVLVLEEGGIGSLIGVWYKIYYLKLYGLKLLAIRGAHTRTQLPFDLTLKYKLQKKSLIIFIQVSKLVRWGLPSHANKAKLRIIASSNSSEIFKLFKEIIRIYALINGLSKFVISIILCLKNFFIMRSKINTKWCKVI